MSERAILFYAFVYHLLVMRLFVSTEDAASGILLPDMQKKGWREKEEYRISVKRLRTDWELIWNKLGTISIGRYIIMLNVIVLYFNGTFHGTYFKT